MLRWLLVLIVGTFLYVPTFAHEHQPGESAARARAVEFMRTWHRPKGNFSGIKHRHNSCCYVSGESQDCFVVKQLRRVDGVLEVFPDSEGHLEFERWYRVDTGVNEDLQEDPRESPDGRSYVCFGGGQVICFVEGSGT